MSVAQMRAIRLSVGVMDEFTPFTDEELLTESLKNPRAFESLLARYQSQFLSRAQSVMGTRDAAEDVVQEAFIRMYRFAPRFRNEQGSFRSWALTILMNVARTHYRKSARDRSQSVVLDPEYYESLADTSAATKEGDEEYAREVILKALPQAPQDVQRILTLAFIEDLPYKDIADKEGLSVAAVKTRVHRAKAVLRDIINNLPS